MAGMRPEVRLESRVEQKGQRVEMRIDIIETFFFVETFFKKKKKKRKKVSKKKKKVSRSGVVERCASGET
jgi:hypothetical protein